MSVNGKYPLGFYEWLWLFIGGISAVSILLLVVERFNPVLAVSVSVAIVILAGALLGLRLSFKRDQRFPLGLLAILMLALFFRWNPYPHHIVGQDQGLYVSMSKVYARSGGLAFKDPIRTNLSEQQQKLYDANGGALFDSAVPVDEGKTKIMMCFYPLHPAWMAIFASGLGDSRAGYSAVFFSLLAIVGLYFLTLEISNNRTAAYMTALFAALNPGLVFFTKFPVTEMVALAFTANGFYFLCRGHRQLKEGRLCWVYLVLAAGCFNAFFYTRMSALLYVPFIALLFLCSLIDLPSQKQRVKITGFFLCLVVLFWLSYLFYYALMPGLYKPVIASFCPFRISGLLSIGFMFGALTLFVWWWVLFPARRVSAQMVLRKIALLAPFLIILVLAMHPVWKIIGDDQANFGFRKFADDVPGWHMFFYSSIYRYILYLSPLGFVLLIVGIFSYKIRSNGLITLAVVFSAFMMAVCLFQPYSAYAFYYDRYYLSEVIPSSLMLVAIIIAPSSRAAVVSLSSRWLRWGSVTLIVAYFAFFSICQIGKTEGSYPDFFYEINKIIKSNDLLLCEKYNPDIPREEEGYRRPISATFAVYFNKMVFPVRIESELSRPEISELGKKYDNVYYLSFDKCHDPDYNLAKILRYTEGFFIAGSHAWTDSSIKIMKNMYEYLLPFKHYEFSMPLYLYRLEKPLNLGAP